MRTPGMIQIAKKEMIYETENFPTIFCYVV